MSDRAGRIGLIVGGVWVALLALFWLMAPAPATPPSGLARLMGIMGAVMPLALIALAVVLARTIAALRAEAAELRAGLRAMRETAPAAPARPAASPAPRPPAKAAAPAPAPAQPAPLDPVQMVAALNFPNGPDDHAAIEAMRAVLRHPEAARAIRASQDIVTLLARADIYMDHLPPPSTDPAAWRDFAQGRRNGTLGPMQAEAAVAATAAMIGGDEIFRDAALHFQRHFEAVTAKLIPELDDAQIARLADSRSARAYALIAEAKR